MLSTGNDPPETSSKAKEARINFLLEEYRSLRADLVERTSSRANLLGFLAAAGALITGPGEFNFGPWIPVALGVLLVGISYWLTSLYITRKLGARVVELETVLNQLADDAYGSCPAVKDDKGQDLTAKAKLLWETSLQKGRIAPSVGLR